MTRECLQQCSPGHNRKRGRISHSDATLIFSLHITTITAPPTITTLVKCSGGGVAVHDWASGTGDTIILHPRQFPGDLRQRGGAREKSVSGTRKTVPCLNQANSGHYIPRMRSAPTVPSIVPIHNLSPGWRGELSVLWSDSAL